MNEFLKILLNIRSLRAACRDLSLEQLEEGLQKLSEVVAERQQDEVRDKAQVDGVAGGDEHAPQRPAKGGMYRDLIEDPHAPAEGRYAEIAVEGVSLAPPKCQ